MERKEATTKEDLLAVINILENAGITYWIDGGWGVDGTSKQADLEGGWYEFEKDYFGDAVFEGRSIPCISLKGQQIFHSGYELKDKDKHDILILERLSKQRTASENSL